MKIALCGFGKPVIDIIKILLGTHIKVAYVKIDYERSDMHDFVAELSTLGIKYIYIEDFPSVQVDLVFAINYNRIISKELLETLHFVNYHVGLLPMWRGNSANGWGVINGENYVGYTIHEMQPMLDAGPIYYQFVYPYHEGDTYYKAKNAMQEDLNSKIVQVLDGINDGTIQGKKQSGPYTYCTSFHPVDGFIIWSENTDMILRRFYVFGPPLGTGLKFRYRDKIYTVKKISRVLNFATAVGVPGSVVFRANNSIWVKTGDTAVSLDEVELGDETVNVANSFFIGQRLQ